MRPRPADLDCSVLERHYAPAELSRIRPAQHISPCLVRVDSLPVVHEAYLASLAKSVQKVFVQALERIWYDSSRRRKAGSEVVVAARAQRMRHRVIVKLQQVCGAWSWSARDWRVIGWRG